jgi:hypothetical protein
MHRYFTKMNTFKYMDILPDWPTLTIDRTIEQLRKHL